MTGIITAPKVPGKHSIEHNLPSILILGGAVLVIARVVLPYRAGVIFSGSPAYTQVTTISYGSQDCTEAKNASNASTIRSMLNLPGLG
jgi:hypothetical protein